MTALGWQKLRRILFGLLCCSWLSGCELPRGPMDFSPVRERMHHFGENVFGHQENLQECDGQTVDPSCTDQAYGGQNSDVAASSNCAPHQRKFLRERSGPMVHAKPPHYSPDGVNPPWPKYLPVPTKPVFEPADESVVP